MRNALRHALWAAATAAAWILLLPSEVLAWGPATHIAIGEAVLGSLHFLPPAVSAVLRRYPTPFLYGSVAADISFAKKYAAVGRHSHHWHMGEEILDQAESEALQAVGYGYLAHLAADTIAHNFYVPRQLLLTSAAHTVGHTYWEHRMDVLLGKRFGATAREVVLVHDHRAADELFDRVLSRTLFSFRTNRRLFRGMIAFQDHDRWQKVFDEILRRSRFDLSPTIRDLYVRTAYDHVMDFLANPAAANARSMDPIGEENLRLAKEVRRDTQLIGETLAGTERFEALADQFFPMPRAGLGFADRAPRVDVPGLPAHTTQDAPKEAEQPPPDRPSPETPS